ncbi:MAG: hypothetical protein A3D31_05250 [Candidatus Fluviicola riflensis]|nr:MAG: hypothetical protein CHH17_09765 [Candidatus Fluviicola riflensis]OGS79376.1 MAG: hypothetical protein A3D31_05250 [Candidatus Fluviicola riflensis]OGS86808.1 MAG: hypothetical protein A2724_04710 [Fluviicola sp. RIFCSPHIGHO2_01_FULL_43_53]OGS89598.1 MAG: hypothetical protein A3E30_01455 [Fluviicola sp. RIFCSPHIGHO2_12_FULL_43_24]
MKKFGKILKIAGGMFAFFAIAGKIADHFGYVLKISGADLPPVDWAMAGILLVLGAVFFAIGFFLDRKPEAEAEPVRLDMTDLRFIEKAIKKTRNRSLWIGVFIAAFGAFMLVLPSLDTESTTGAAIGLGIFGGICILIGGFMLYQYLKLRNIRESEVYKKIMIEPQTITRFQTVVVQSQAGKSFNATNVTLFVGTKRLTTLGVSDTDLELLKQYLLKHNKDIFFG